MIRYCVACGARMGYKSTIRAYNVETGRPIYKVVFRCPNARWWSFGWLTWRLGHPSETVYLYLDGEFTEQQRKNLEGLDG